MDLYQDEWSRLTFHVPRCIRHVLFEDNVYGEAFGQGVLISWPFSHANDLFKVDMSSLIAYSERDLIVLAVRRVRTV